MKQELRKLLYPILILSTLSFMLVVVRLFAASGSDLLQRDPKAMDFLAFYTGAEVLDKRGGSFLYDFNAQLSIQQQISPVTKQLHIFLPFLNPPFVATFFLPFIWLPLVPAYIVWTTANVFLLALLCIIAWRQLLHNKWYLRAAMIIGILTFMPIMTSLLLGQLTIIVALVLLFAWITLKNGHEFYGGLLLSLLLIKPHFFLLAMFAVLVQRRKRLVMGVVAGVLLLISFSLLVVGWQGVLGYASFLLMVASIDRGYGIDIKAQHSLQTALLYITGATSLSEIRLAWIIGVVLAVLASLFLWVKKYPLSSPQFSVQFVLLIITSLIISPHTHFHDLTLLVVGGIVLISSIKQRYRNIFMWLLSLEYLCALIGVLFLLSDPWTNEVWIVISVGLLVVFAGTCIRLLGQPALVRKK